MANEWNNFFDSLFNAGANIFKGVTEKNAQDDALEVYRTAMENIKKSIGAPPVESVNNVDAQKENQAPVDFVSSLFKGASEQAPLEENIANLQSAGSDRIGNIAPEIKKSVNTVDALQKQPQKQEPFDVFWQGINDLLAKGKYGEQYISPLTSYYEGKKPVAPETKTQIENGYLILYDTKGNVLKKTKIKDEEVKKEKGTLELYQGMSVEDAMKLPVNEIENSFLYFSPAVQEELRKKYPVLQQKYDQMFKEGDFSKNLSTGRHLGVPKINFEDKTLEKKGQDLFDISKQIDAEGGYEKVKNDNPGLAAQHDALVNYLKANGINDWIQWREDMASGVKVKDAQNNQKQFEKDYNDIVFSKRGIYDNLISLWNIDSANKEGADAIQQGADALYNWLGENIHNKVDYPLEKAIYEYVNNEIGKIWISKFGHYGEQK